MITLNLTGLADVTQRLQRLIPAPLPPLREAVAEAVLLADAFQIRDKLARGDWRAHLGHSPSIFVNAATWGLLITGKLVATTSERSLATALTRLIARSGEPVIRTAVDLAMRLLGKQFVTGETIAEALKSATAREARGYRAGVVVPGCARKQEPR